MKEKQFTLSFRQSGGTRLRHAHAVRDVVVGVLREHTDIFKGVKNPAGKVRVKIDPRDDAEDIVIIMQQHTGPWVIGCEKVKSQWLEQIINRAVGDAMPDFKLRVGVCFFFGRDPDPVEEIEDADDAPVTRRRSRDGARGWFHLGPRRARHSYARA